MPGTALKKAAPFLFQFFLSRNIPEMKFTTSGTFLLLIGDLNKLDLN